MGIPSFKHGMVATSQPAAAAVGIDILKAGGNAVDAAIAVNAMLTVVEPHNCGLGGDLFAIVWEAQTGKLHGLNASGRSPFAISRDLFKQRGLDRIPLRGPLSWSVPGCVDGWFELHGRLGRMDIRKILEPAISAGNDGFAVTPVIASAWHGQQRMLSESAGGRQAFLKDGRAPKAGERMTNAPLATTLERIAREGRDLFYDGPIAEKLVAFSEQVGGLFSLRDFTEHRSTWVDPVSTNYRGCDVWELPPNGQGIAVLEILNLLELYDVAGMGHNSVEFLHTFIEAKKLTYADRAAYYADPEVEQSLPIEKLISKGYARYQRWRLNPDHAAMRVPAGDPKLRAGDTVYLTVVDKDRNAVSLIQSTYYGYGSGLIPEDLGFAIQNRGTLFALDEHHHNRLEPHKRPFHTIIPAMVTRDGKAEISFGVMGGDMQPQGQVQVLVNMLDHGMDPHAAGAAPRCRHDGSDTPTGDIMTDGGRVWLEPGISEEVLEGLRAKGHQAARARGGFGGYQAIRIDWNANTLTGGSEPRLDGQAVGY